VIGEIKEKTEVFEMVKENEEEIKKWHDVLRKWSAELSSSSQVRKPTQEEMAVPSTYRGTVRNPTQAELGIEVKA